VAVPAAALAVLAPSPAPAAWVANTVRAATPFAAGCTAAAGARAVALSQGVLNAMKMTAIKVAAALLLLAGLGTGASVWTCQALAADPQETPRTDPAAGERPGKEGQKKDRPGDKKERPGGVPRERDEPGIRGILKGVDAAKKTIDVTVARDGGEIQEHLLPVAKDAAITADGKEKAGLADLKPGMRVQVGLSKDRKTAVRIRAESGRPRERQNNVSGTLRKVDGKENTVTVTVVGPREGQFQDQTFKLPRDFPVAGLQPGARVILQLSADRSTVLSIRVARGDKE
jgi:hypothetical protein